MAFLQSGNWIAAERLSFGRVTYVTGKGPSGLTRKRYASTPRNCGTYMDLVTQGIGLGPYSEGDAHQL